MAGCLIGLMVLVLGLSVPAYAADNAIGIEIGGRGLFGAYAEFPLTESRVVAAGFSEDFSIVSFLFGAEDFVRLYYANHAWLLGEGGNKLELALGPTYVRREIEYLLPDTDSETRIAWMLTGVIGYRYQSSDGFFQFRVGATPALVLHDNGVYSRRTMIRPYLSLGVHF